MLTILKKMKTYTLSFRYRFFTTNFKSDILKQINEELAKEMRNEFDKQKERKSINIYN